MNKTIIYILTAAVMICMMGIAHAEAPQWKIDPAHTGIYFGVDHIFSKVKGQFKEFDAEVFFDRNNLAESRTVFTVKVNSVYTNNTKRDGHLQSDDFFGEKRYPEMRFESKSVKHTGGNQYMLDGTMTIKDVSRNIQVPITFFGTKDDPFDPKKEVTGFEARLTIDRLDYNVGNGKFLEMGIVGREVEIFITVEATKKK
jgi:polyisoprenoid-binding protein YceI